MNQENQILAEQIHTALTELELKLGETPEIRKMSEHLVAVNFMESERLINDILIAIRECVDELMLGVRDTIEP